MSNLIYDGYFVVTLSNNNYNFSNVKGAFSGNGKIALYNSMNKIGTDQVICSVGEINFDQIGKYKNNIIEGFSLNDIRLFGTSNSNISYKMESQRLDMLTGSCTSVFEVRSNNLIPIKVESKITPLRQYPYCILHKVDVTPSSNMNYLDVFHLHNSHSKLTMPDYNNNTFFNDKIYSDKGLYVMNSKAFNQETNSMVTAASCYLGNSNLLGFNITNKKESCFQQMRFMSVTESNTFTFNTLSVMMTDKDFPDPLEESKRILMNIAFKNADTDELVTQLEYGSESDWYTLWTSDIELNEKLGVTQGESDRIKRLRQYIRHSMFNIFCCVREGVNSEVNPLSLSYIDTNGNLFYDGDVWLVPTLLLLKPSIAKTLLEFKYKGLEQAVQLAASFGYKGSKYPYQNDVVGYRNVYWDVASPLHIFNNCIISINVWNYYRLTIDKEWLSDKGYIIMKNIADFIVANIGNNYNMTNVNGLGGRISTNHGFTKYLAKLALKYTLEASYELNYAPKNSWTTSYLNLDVSYYTDANYDVVKYDSSYTNNVKLDIVDNWFILLPYYSYLYFNNVNNVIRDHNSILRNINYYSNAINTNFQNNPYNLITLASLYGLVSQSDTSYLNTFYTKIDDIIDQCGRKDYWGNLVNDPTNGVDIAVDAYFVMLFLNIVGGLRVKGGITEGKFYYEPYGIQGPYTINMPNTWKNVVYSAVGNNQELYNVINNIALV